jgi:hypothetical protein
VGIINRWGKEISIGDEVSALLSRGGSVDGRVVGIDRHSGFARAYGPQVKLSTGYSVGADDVHTVVTSQEWARLLVLCIVENNSTAAAESVIHLLKPDGTTACGAVAQSDADCNFVSCERCTRIHEQHEEQEHSEGRL